MPSSPSIGEMWAGRYELQRLLGEGSRKQVYLAHDARLDRDVALALIKTEGLDSGGRTRIRREAQAMGRLGDHPHVVTIYDVGEQEDRPYLVAEYLQGGSVEQLLAANAGTLSLELAVRLGEEICSALEHAHARGVVHRDLKPANVWLTAEGTAKLGDFGLALDRQRSRVTVEGLMVGTVAYMAPEQALAKAVDGRADLYALGALLYEMVAGRPPFVGDDAVVVISQHLYTTPVAPSWHNPAVRRDLEALILGLLEKDPGRRPQSARAVREELARLRTQGVEQPATIGDQALAQTVEASRWLAEPASNPLDGLDAGVFVGREQEITTLRAAVEDALAGRGRVVLISGEPGIGKTRIAREAATYAQLRGIDVLWGRCHESAAAPAYWPWVQIMRGYVHGHTAQDLRRDMGSGAADIAKVFSAVRERLPEFSGVPRQESDEERFRLFDSVSTFLTNAATQRPLMLILDDGHWADPSSLLLLEFLAREMAESRLTVLVTYRDEEVQRGHPLLQTLAELARTAVSRRLALGGLDEAAVGQLIERTAGEQPAAALVAAVSHQTEGNPFFAGEVVRWLVSEGRLQTAATDGIGVPPNVREVLGRRCDRLSPECNRLLIAAAAIGRDFDVRVLQATGGDGATADAVPDLLDEAIAARVIVEAPNTPDHYVFAHALIREALYSELTPARRQRLHQRVGQAIEALHATQLEPHLAALAHHFGEAAPLGESRKALDYAIRAGRRAADLLAYEDAVTHYERALALLESHHGDDDAMRCDILVRLGDNQYHAGDRDRAQLNFRLALDLARRLPRPDLLARAALGFAAPFVTRLAYELGVFDPNMIAALEEALASLPTDDSTLRARVLSCLANALEWSPTLRHRMASLSEEAVAMARRIGDPPTLIAALFSRRVAFNPHVFAEERLAVETELLEIALRHGDREAVLMAHDLRRTAFLELGRIDEFEREWAIFEQLAAASRGQQFHYHVLQWRAARALLDGRLDDAEQLASETYAAGTRFHNRGAIQGLAVQTVLVKRERGTLGDMEAGFRASVARYPHMPAWRAGMALMFSELGRADEALAELDALTASGFFEHGREQWFFLLAAAQAAEVCHALNEPSRAARLYELLLPDARMNVLAGGAACFGSVSRYLGLLATTLRRWDEAESHFATALEMDTRLRASVWVARGQHEWAVMLLRRDAFGDRAKALRLLGAAAETAHSRGMKVLLEKILARRLEAQRIAPEDVQGSIDLVAASVSAERPDLRYQAAPDGTVTILFTDIEGFTAITERLGDRRAHALLQAHNRIVRDQLRRHTGFEVKSQGDGFMIAFQSARRAVLCAIAVQRALAGYAAEHPEEPIRVRIGLHAGETIKEGEDFFGNTVNLAARVAEQARGGEILISSIVKELTETTGDVHFGTARNVLLKGVTGARTVFSISWGGEPEPVPAAAVERPPNAAVLRREGAFWTLIYGGMTNRLKDGLGLRYLSQLLHHPGREFHVLDLVQGPSVGQRAEGEPSPDTQNTGLEILDARAKAAYQRRIAELREDVEEAEQLNDTGRLARARGEMEAISEQLAGAVGLGGRGRAAASTAERARVAVTKRLKDTLTRIGQQDSLLGNYLARSVKTGLFCTYVPDLTRAIEWILD